MSDMDSNTELNSKNEERRELARLITQSMSGNEHQIDGRVAEAVNHLDDCAGIQSWNADLTERLKKKPKRWFQSWTMGKAKKEVSWIEVHFSGGLSGRSAINNL